MSELSPELRDLVLATRRVNLATEADAARVLVGLRARLGDAAVLGIEATHAITETTSSGLAYHKILALSVAGLAIVGGLWLTKVHNRDASATTNSVTSAAATSSVSVAIVPNAMSSRAPATIDTATNVTELDTTPSPDRVEARPVALHNGKDRLAEEVALIARAETALHNGNPAIALQVLNEHERQFRTGQLAEERTAARVQTLCALGRTTEADAQLAQLSPKSLHGARSQACVSHGHN